MYAIDTWKIKRIGVFTVNLLVKACRVRDTKMSHGLLIIVKLKFNTKGSNINN